MGSKHIFQCHSKNMPTYLLTFYLERAIRYMNGFRPIFGRFRRIFYRLQNNQNPQLKIAKIMIFWNILKIDLKGFWYRFWVQNNSKTPQVCSSDHISCTRPLPAELSKIDFLARIVIFHMFSKCSDWARIFGKMFFRGLESILEKWKIKNKKKFFLIFLKKPQVPIFSLNC